MIKYNGIAYSFRNYNCWHHACAVRKDKGIETPPFYPADLKSAFNLITDKIDSKSSGLKKVDTAQDYDIAIVTKNLSGRKLHHCGIVWGDKISHCCRVKKQVVIDDFKKFCLDFDGVTFWR